MLPFDEISSPDKVYLVWLAAFAVALALALIGVMCRMLRSGRVTRVSWAIWSLGSLLPVGVCLADACGRLDGALTGPLALVAKALLIAGLTIACYLIARGPAAARAAASQLAANAEAGRSATSPARRLSWALLAGNAVAAVWASVCFYDAVNPQDFSPLPLPPATHWVKVAGAEAVTDQGTFIDLLTAEKDAQDDRPLSAYYAERFRERVIEIASLDDRSNCHGWVFAGGRFAIASQDVDTILHDNQYDLVEQPRAGDLIVYRDGAGGVLHSGIVRLAEHDLVLVESKWGAHARYLHRPLDQAYSANFTFYRSPRRGHVMPLEGELLVASHDAPNGSPEDAGSDVTNAGATTSGATTSIATTPIATTSARRPAGRAISSATLSNATTPSAAASNRLASGDSKPLAAKKLSQRPQGNPLWWPMRPPVFSYKPFPWYGPGAYGPGAMARQYPGPGLMKKQERG